MTEWRPIETATSSAGLVYSPRLGVTWAMRRDGKPGWITYYGEIIEPSHWHPSPPPPEKPVIAGLQRVTF